MFRSILAGGLLLGALTIMAEAKDHSAEGHECALDFKPESIDGQTVDLEKYEGKVVLIVNTASRCGYTPQYAGLEKLYQKYKDKGFVVLGFPCNQFGGQEPGTDAQIKEFCSTEFNVSFPMFSKVEVKGDDAAPIYKYLTNKDVKPAGKGDVEWNFEKFLIDREGNVVHRYRSSVKPSDDELVKAIEDAMQSES